VLFFCCVAAIATEEDTTHDKIKPLKEVGVTLVESPAKIDSKIFEFFKHCGLVE
jgi:succinyl-CoA synthetase alpha subunit